MSDVPRRHPWVWIQWIVLAIFVVLWVPSFFDLALAWMWIGFAALLMVALGIAELFTPAWALGLPTTVLAVGACVAAAAHGSFRPRP